MKKKLTLMLSLTAIAIASINLSQADTGMLELGGELLPDPTSYTHSPVQQNANNRSNLKRVYCLKRVISKSN